MSYLGIDLGTSGIRVLLVNDDGLPIGSAEREYAVSHPQSGWSEQNPDDWIQGLESAITEIRSSFSEFTTLKGIGVAGQMHGATCLDKNGKVLRPCILWNDTRSHNEASRLDQTNQVRELSGNIVFAGFTAPKLEWIRTHEPEIFKKISTVLLPAAFINFYLTGDYVADMSDSAGTSWLDTGNRCWSDTLLDIAHMRRDQMPRLVEGTEAAGQLRSQIMASWGLSEKVIIAGGAGDNAAAACGIGALSKGQGFVSLGTSGVLLAGRDGYRPAPETAVHTFCHAIPDRWYQMGVMLSATDSLNWLAGVTGSTPAALTDALGADVQNPARVQFYPYLSGERTPHNDSDIRGGFTGLATDTTRNDLTQAVLEGVAFGLRDSLEALRSTGAELDSLVAIGGGTRSLYWVELISTVLGLPLKLPKGREFGAALGAARLGLAATNGLAAESFMHGPEINTTVDPREELVDAFDASYQSFRSAYPNLKLITS